MANVRKIVLDVLKPHQPNALEFAATLAELSPDYQVRLTVTEMDEKTESTMLVIIGQDIKYEAIEEAVKRVGASVHSIDEVEVFGSESDADLK